MTPYTFTLYLGAAGLVTMAVSGVSHAGHGHGHGHQGGNTGGHDAGHASLGGHGGHGGHALGSGHGAGHAGGHGPALPGGHGAGAHHGHHDFAGSAGRTVASLLSPRVLFSVLVGFGATGSLLSPWLGGVLLLAVAMLGGVLFEALLVAPIWKFLFRFASNPALTLESTLMDVAHAASGFDAAGHGLVAVELDGQVVQLLGTLRAEDRTAGVRVRAGDRVRIEDVDTDRNRCTVSYLGR